MQKSTSGDSTPLTHWVSLEVNTSKVFKSVINPVQTGLVCLIIFQHLQVLQPLVTCLCTVQSYPAIFVGMRAWIQKKAYEYTKTLACIFIDLAFQMIKALVTSRFR